MELNLSHLSKYPEIYNAIKVASIDLSGIKRIICKQEVNAMSVADPPVLWDELGELQPFKDKYRLKTIMSVEVHLKSGEIRKLTVGDNNILTANSEQTYEVLAERLKTAHSVVFAWTDGDFTRFDVLMSYGIPQIGNLQRGMNASTHLFVAIAGIGMFGFALNNTEKHPSYVGEKLNLGSTNVTTVKLAELINGVCSQIIGDEADG